MNKKPDERYNSKYLINLGLYDLQERIIDFDKNIDDLTEKEIHLIKYMYCRDLSTGAEILFAGNEIKNVIDIYGNYLLRKTNGKTFSIKEYIYLEKVCDNSKKLDDHEQLDLLWEEISLMQEPFIANDLNSRNRRK